MPDPKNKKFRPPPPKSSPAPEPAARAAPLPVPAETPAPVAVAPITPWWQALGAAFLIVLAGLLAYSNSFSGDFVLDDLPAIKENLSIQQGWATPPPPLVKPGPIDRLFLGLPAPLQPPNDGQTVTGRPLVNISFALNYAWSKKHSPDGKDGFVPANYHAVSLAIHLLAGLTLFGLVRRTLELPKVRAAINGGALPVAFLAALWWTVHPLQTESVTYLSQRAESLMGLFYLLTFYCFVRGTQAWPWLWQPLAVLSCLTATFCKEVTVTLPLMIFLYDWIFVAKNPEVALLRRWPVYAGLLLAMLPLAVLVLHSGNRGESAGLGLGLPWYNYAKAQFPAIVNYLKLIFWPDPLVLYYGESTELTGAPFTLGTAAAMLVVLSLVGSTIYLLWRKPMLGFLGLWFFVILAPSSSVLPVITETAAEHRLYLSLAAVTVLVTVGLWRQLGRLALPGAVAVALALGLLTFIRNFAYHDGLDLWRDSVSKRPDIARAHENYGIMLYQAGRVRESVAEYFTALRIKPDYPDCDNNLGNSLGALGQYEDAVKYYRRAVANLRRPGDQAVAAYNMGNSLRALERMDDALAAYNFAGNLAQYAPAFNNMGSIYSQLQKYDQAIESYQQALKLQPGFSFFELNLADAYQNNHQPDLAEPHYLRAIQENPNNPDPHAHLGVLYNNNGKFAEAAREFATALQLAPDSPDIHYYLGVSLTKLNRLDEAIREFEAALKLNANHPAAKAALAEVQTAAAKNPAARP